MRYELLPSSLQDLRHAYFEADGSTPCLAEHVSAVGIRNRNNLFEPINDDTTFTDPAELGFTTPVGDYYEQ